MIRPTDVGATGRWTVSPHVAVETVDESGVVVFHSATSARLRLSHPLYALLRRFSSGTTPEEAMEVLDDATARQCLATLLERGFLVAADDAGEPADTGAAAGAGDGVARARPLAPNPYTLFQCPRGRAGTRAVDVSVIGVPCDLGAEIAGARDAPLEIRRRTAGFAYECDFATGRPLGWYDATHRERVLEGVTFADLGDVRFHYGEALDAVLERTTEATRGALDQGSFPVVIGGDRTVALGPIRALADRGPVAVVWASAVGGPGTATAWRAALRAAALPHVERLVHVGARDTAAAAPAADGIAVVTVAELRERGTAALVDVLPPELPCYVSLDIGALDPAHAPGVAVPYAGGLSTAELTALLRELGGHREVLGMDVCDVAPARDPGLVTVATAAHLLIAGLGAFVRRARGDDDQDDNGQGERE